MLLLRAGDTLSGQAARRLTDVSTAGKLKTVWKVKVQLPIRLRTKFSCRGRRERRTKSPA